MKRARAHQMVDLENNQGPHCRLKPCTPLRSDSQLLNTGSAAADTDFNNTLAMIPLSCNGTCPAPGDHNSANQLQFSQDNSIYEKGSAAADTDFNNTLPMIPLSCNGTCPAPGDHNSANQLQFSQDNSIYEKGSAAADTDLNNTLPMIPLSCNGTCPAPGDHNSDNQLQFSQDNSVYEKGDQKNGEGMAKTSQVVSFTASSSSTAGGIDPQNTRIRECEEHLIPPEGTALDDAEDAPVSMEDVHRIGLIGDSHESDIEVISDHNLPLQENHLGSNNVNGGGSSVTGETENGQSEGSSIRILFDSEEECETFVDAILISDVICQNELVNAWMLNQKHIYQEYRAGRNVNSEVSSAIGDTDGGQTTSDFTEPQRPSLVVPYEAFRALVAVLPLVTKLREAFHKSLPWWTVSYMMSRTTMEKVMAFCRLMKLVRDMDDQNLRSFLEERLRMEKSGLSDDTITRRLRVYVLPAAPSNLGVPVMRAEHSDTCNICLAEYKDQAKVASLYYCSHEYHADCIKQWLLKTNVCPMCRALAIIPEHHPAWDGDIKQHRESFMHK